MNLNTIKNKYEAFRPLIVWLGITELIWMSYWLLRIDDSTPLYTMSVIVCIIVMLMWLTLVIKIGRKDFFLKYSKWFSNIVGTTIVVTFPVILFSVLPFAGEGLISAATQATDRELASIHILRLLAIGTIIKYIQRELPLHFLLLGSLPDFMFAVSAIIVTLLASGESLTQGFYITWHSIGAAVFLGAGISMFLSVPSPLRIFQTEPDTSLVFRFPMLLAPNFTVPLFILAHLFALVKMTAGG